MDAEELYHLQQYAALLAEQGETAQLRAHLLDLGGMAVKVNELGYAKLDEDLSLLDADPHVRSVRAALRRASDALEPLRPANAMRVTLLSRLPAGGAREAVMAGTEPADLVPRLDPIGPSPGGARPLAQVIPGDTEVTALAGFPDGRRLLRGDRFGAVEVFDVELGELDFSLPGHRGPITAVAVSPDGLRVAVGDAHGGLRLWALDEVRGMPAGDAAFDVHAGVSHCAFLPRSGRLVVVTDDGTPLIGGASLTALESPSGPDGYRDVGTFVVAPGEDWIAAQLRGDGHGAHVWDTMTGRLVQARPDIGLITSSSDGNLIAVHGDDLVVWEPRTARVTRIVGPGWLSHSLLDRLRRHVRRNRSSWIAGVRAGPDGSWLARVDQLELTEGETIQQRATLRIRDLDRGTDHTLDFPGTLGALVTDAAGVRLMVGTDHGHAAGDVHLWRSGDEPRYLGTHAGPVVLGTVSAGGEWAASADRHGTIRLWPAGEPTAGRPADLARVMTSCDHPDGADWFVAVDTDRTAYVAETATGELRHRLVSRERITFVNAIRTTCAIAPDGSWLATADDDGTVYFWDPAAGERRATSVAHSAQVVSSAASRRWLATIGHDGVVLIQPPFSTRPSRRLELGTGFWPLCRADPAGGWLAVAGHGADLHLILTGEHRVVRMPAAVTALGIHGSRLLVGDAAGGLSAVDPGESRPRPVHRVASPVRHVVTSPDLAWTAVVTDARIEIVRPAGPVVIDRYVESVVACRPSPDGSLLATADNRRTLRIWDPATGRPVTGLRVDGRLTDLSWLDRVTLCAAGSRGAALFRLVR